jgi:hypothetical protein
MAASRQSDYILLKCILKIKKSSPAGWGARSFEIEGMQTITAEQAHHTEL